MKGWQFSIVGMIFSMGVLVFTKPYYLAFFPNLYSDALPSIMALSVMYGWSMVIAVNYDMEVEKKK
jgi:hypothetical protein